jgi:NAD(P)-dependent dehydrogenase (short-subunit alcohol dehydrogenase family)
MADELDARCRDARPLACQPVFRTGLLKDVPVAVTGPARPAITQRLQSLDADIRALDIDSDEDAPVEARGLHALVVDAAAPFAAASGDRDELAPLRAAGDAAWIATRAIANAAWIEPKEPGGKVILVAPRPADGAHAEAARAALENLARTLSIEWARYGIRTTAIAPGAQWSDDDVAGVVAYLVSPGGDYFSGTRLG